jgi:hypothetical protein
VIGGAEGNNGGGIAGKSRSWRRCGRRGGVGEAEAQVKGGQDPRGFYLGIPELLRRAAAATTAKKTARELPSWIS